LLKVAWIVHVGALKTQLARNWEGRRRLKAAKITGQ
jgi:hypothetical protein